MGRKLKIVLSDLHLGDGYLQNNYQGDVAVDKILARFLHMIRHESEQDQREVELIINGDFFEFLHVPAVDNYDPTQRYPTLAYLNSSEPASIKRLNIIIDSHPGVFEALSDFIQVGEPQRRITIIKGNHDVNLYWPGVKSRLREVLGASGSRSSLLLFAAEFVSREKIYVEHGHQRAEKMNSYHDFVDPRLPSDPSQLYYPAGSHFLINLFNNLGRERWFIDHLKPITTLIWHALSWDFDLAVRMLTDFIRHTPALVLSDFVYAAQGALPADAWLQHLTNLQTRRDLARRYADDAAFRLEFHQHVCRYLGDANIASGAAVAPPLPEPSDDPLALARFEQQQQQAMLCLAAAEVAQQEGARVVVFGHTHRPMQEVFETGSVYINTGCWVPDLSEAPPELWRGLFAGAVRYHDLPLRLPYARIDYDDDNQPRAQLLDFADELAAQPGESPEKASGRFFDLKISELAKRWFKL